MQCRLTNFFFAYVLLILLHNSAEKVLNQHLNEFCYSLFINTNQCFYSVRRSFLRADILRAELKPADNLKHLFLSILFSIKVVFLDLYIAFLGSQQRYQKSINNIKTMIYFCSLNLFHVVLIRKNSLFQRIFDASKALIIYRFFVSHFDF